MKSGSANINGGTVTVLDLSVQEQSIRDARRAFCDMLSERTLIALLSGDARTDGTDEAFDQAIVSRAWRLAELQYDEMIRRRSIDTPTTLTERMAVQNMLRSA